MLIVLGIARQIRQGSHHRIGLARQQNALNTTQRVITGIGKGRPSHCHVGKVQRDAAQTGARVVRNIVVRVKERSPMPNTPHQVALFPTVQDVVSGTADQGVVARPTNNQIVPCGSD